MWPQQKETTCRPFHIFAKVGDAYGISKLLLRLDVLRMRLVIKANVGAAKFETGSFAAIMEAGGR